jgi:hypothetical protein
MTKVPPGPKEIRNRELREAKQKRGRLVPYAGKPFQRESETSIGLKNAQKKRGK